nr:uncharacterized protein LOC120103424 [Rattus norvegicus]
MWDAPEYLHSLAAHRLGTTSALPLILFSEVRVTPRGVVPRTASVKDAELSIVLPVGNPHFLLPGTAPTSALGIELSEKAESQCQVIRAVLVVPHVLFGTLASGGQCCHAHRASWAGGAAGKAPGGRLGKTGWPTAAGSPSADPAADAPRCGRASSGPEAPGKPHCHSAALLRPGLEVASSWLAHLHAIISGIRLLSVFVAAPSPSESRGPMSVRPIKKLVFLLGLPPAAFLRLYSICWCSSV